MAIPGTPGAPGRKAWDDDDLTRLDSIKNKQMSVVYDDAQLHRKQLLFSLSYLSSSLPTESIRPASKSKSAQSRRDTNRQIPFAPDYGVFDNPNARYCKIIYI